MRLVTKVASGCVSLTTAPGHAFVYAADGTGTIHVLGSQGETVHTKVKNPDGAYNLALMKGNTRLMYTGFHQRHVEWREVKQSGRFPAGGMHAFPADESTVICTGVSPDGRVVAAGHAAGKIGLYRFGDHGRSLNRLQYRCHVEIPGRPRVNCLGMSGATRTFLTAAWENRACVMMLQGDSPPAVIGDVTPGLKFREIARHARDAAYAILDDSRLLRVAINEGEGDGEAAWFPTLGAPDLVRVPGGPSLVSIAVSPCGGFVAVGADYNQEYGAVLLYDATDLRPLAMFDTSSEPTALEFAEFVTTEILHDPYAPVDHTELALFSGHDNGQVIKWYISRQLQWLSRIAERPSGRRAEPTDPGYTGGAPERALDI